MSLLVFKNPHHSQGLSLNGLLLVDQAISSQLTISAPCLPAAMIPDMILMD